MEVSKKIFFKILLMVLFLNACSSYTKIDSNKSGNIIKIKSALIENDNLYILSDSSNYHFYRSNYQPNSDEEIITNQILNYQNRFFI